MSATLTQPITLAEFLAWEERQELRWEFDGTRPVAMNGGTWAHQTIGANIVTALTNRLRGKPCRPGGPSMKIEVMGRIRYPDAFVVCSPRAPKDTVVRDPTVVFEVLSDGTSRTDRIAKLREYAATPSIQRYVILEQTAIGAMVFVRKGDNLLSETMIEGEILRLPEIGIEIPMAELYEGVEVEPLEEL